MESKLPVIFVRSRDDQLDMVWCDDDNVEVGYFTTMRVKHFDEAYIPVARVRGYIEAIERDLKEMGERYAGSQKDCRLCDIDEKDGKVVGCDAYFEFTNPTKEGALLSYNHRADPKPRPWLRAEEVRESGSYWWRNDTSYATPVTVYVMKSGTDESCFASAGQLGWWKAMQLKDLGGLWQRIPEPELPEEDGK